MARELTKRFEEVRRGTLADLAAAYGGDGAPRGEVVVVVGPPAEEAGVPHAIPGSRGGPEAAPEVDVDAELRRALREMSVRDAAAAVAARSGRPRREVYGRALELARAAKGGR